MSQMSIEGTGIEPGSSVISLFVFIRFHQPAFKGAIIFFPA